MSANAETPQQDTAPGSARDSLRARFWNYVAGLGLAALLTATSLWAASASSLWGPGIALGLGVLGIAQMGVHLVFFLHITTGPDNTNNVLALAFGLLIVTLLVGGSLWIMANLDMRMMAPPPALTDLHRQR